MQAAVQTGGGFAASGALAAAAVARDEPDATQIDEMRQANVELFARLRNEELLGRNVFGKRITRKTEVSAVH
jgi:hypothetical protein